MNNGIFGGIDFNQGIEMPTVAQESMVEAAQETAVTVYDPDHFKNWEEFKTQDITLEQLKKTNRELNVAAYTVRRIYSTIHIKGFDDGESDQSLAIGYNQQGLEVAIGRNVRICHNQTILGADRIIRTYTRGQGRVKERITYTDVLNKVVEWMQNIHNITFQDDQKIARMKATVIPPAKIFMLIGMLDATRVACDTKYKEIKLNGTYPLNDWQIHSMTEQLLLRNAHNQQVTAWDFYSIANDMYKPQLMDTTQLFPQNEAMVSFIDQYVMAPKV